METVWVSLVTLIAGALISGVVTYVGARRALALDYDADLRTKRIAAYSDLWSRLEPLAKYVPKQYFSGAEAKQLAESLRTWYFERGGLFLSDATRTDYFALQDLLGHLVRGWGWETAERETLTPAAREHVRTYGSRLRTSLTQDVGTRTRPKLRGPVEPVDRKLAGCYQRDDGQQLRLGLRRSLLRRSTRVTLDVVEGPSVDVLEWSPGRLTIRAMLPDADGNPRERVLLIEGRNLVEGPPLDEENPSAPVLWSRVSSPST